MKSTLVLSALIALVAAAPTEITKRANGKTCIEVCATSASVLTCASGWYALKDGDCWSCCQLDGEETPEDPPAPTATSSPANGPICDRQCSASAEEAECPASWHAELTGECWSCCEDATDAAPVPTEVPEPTATEAPVPVETGTAKPWNESICDGRCASGPQTAMCGVGAHAVNTDGCWQCCMNPANGGAW